MEAHLSLDETLEYAELLVEIGDLLDAEVQVAGVLEQKPEDIAGLDLLAKIKHMRGELSAAIACWAQVHARSPQNQTALMRLSSLMHLAREASQGPGNFLVLGPFQLWRKPAAHLELEEVFRTFLARRPDEAREQSDELARKYAGKDPDLYKLAVLAKAWIAELSGDLEAARSILEDLGNERGFETDGDRILALARLYERIGTPELLEGALKIYRVCEQREESVSIFGHLAAISRRLGRQEDATLYEKQFFELFRRRMHRPSFAAALRVASRHYVPLFRLDQIRFPDRALPSRTEPRGRAIGLALTGDTAGAEALFGTNGDLLDRKYLADLAVLRDSPDDAERLYLESLEQGPADRRVIEWLLERYAESGSRPAAKFFRKPANAERAAEVLQAALKMTPQRPRLWRQLAGLDRILGRDAEAAKHRDRAAALDEAIARRRSVGRSLADAVYHFVGKAKGIIHEVWVTRRLAEHGRGGFLEEILGNATPEMAGAVRNTFLSVREYAQAKWPHQTSDILEYSYTYKITKEDEPSGGLSAGLPSALAFLSVFLNRPIPQDVASSGVLVADAHDVDVLRPVGEVEYKVRGAYNRNLRLVILPTSNRSELESSALVPASVCAEIVRYAANLDEAVELTFGQDVWLQ
jgi:tetratricopeptide (TPR) repeat protein